MSPNLGDLLLYSLDDLEEIAAEKGGITNCWMKSGVKSIRPTLYVAMLPTEISSRRHKSYTRSLRAHSQYVL